MTTSTLPWNKTELTQELADHTRAIVTASGNVHEIARLVGVGANAIYCVMNRRFPNVLITTMEALYDIRPEQFVWAPDAELIRRLEVIRAATCGHSYTRKGIPRVGLPYLEKDRYAAHLHCVRHWKKSDVSRVLRMSGSRVTLAVGKYS